MKNWKLTLLLSAFSLLFTQACATDDVPSKGEEEEALAVDGKNDSFFKPTVHGAMAFGVSNSGAITSDARFHSWEFEVSGKASVTLTTSIDTPNLDTVMYLYTREDSSQTWGRYIKKNDDYKGNIWSQITREVGEGQYRVIIKAYKKSMAGNFQLSGTCEGAGCPVVKECKPDVAASLPGETDFDAACTGNVFRVLNTPVTHTTNRTVQYVNKCDYPTNEGIFADHYAEYWSANVGDLVDIFGFDSEEDVEIYVSIAHHGDAGFSVTCDVGGDEDGLTIIYDAKLNPLTAFWHNQSPVAGFYCAEGGEDEGMHEDCLSQLMWRGEEVEVEGKTATGTVTVGDDIEDYRVAAAVARFAADHNVKAGEQVIWATDTGSLMMSVENSDVFTQYVVGDNYIFMVIEDGDVKTVCENLE